MTDAYPIRPIDEDEFPAFYAVAEHAFSSNWPTETAREHERAVFEVDRSLAAFDDVLMVGTTCAFSFQLTVPGAALPTAGVSAVTTLPSHRRRGILTSLMRRQLADIRDRGEPLAALFSSEAGIYGRFGYGIASLQARFTIHHGEGRMAPHVQSWRDGDGQGGASAAAMGTPTLRMAEPDAARAELAKVYGAVLPGRPGFVARDDRWWTNALLDPDYWRDGACPLRCVVAEDQLGPRGYALFSVKPSWGEDSMPAGVLNVRELMATDPAAAAALWSDLLSRDLVSEVRARLRPVDDPLPLLLADFRRARTQLTDGLWIRLVDVPKALARRRYARDVDVVIEVSDELFSQNAGRWRLQAAAATGGGTDADSAQPSCQRTSAAADIALPVRALAAAYLGGPTIGALARAGLITELTPGAVAVLSAAMSWDPAPWCPMIF